MKGNTETVFPLLVTPPCARKCLCHLKIFQIAEEVISP
jgi:hypothetical protein